MMVAANEFLTSSFRACLSQILAAKAGSPALEKTSL